MIKVSNAAVIALLSSIAPAGHAIEFENVSIKSGVSNVRTGYTIWSPGGDESLGNPTSTLVFTGRGTSHSLSATATGATIFGREKDIYMKVSWASDLSGGEFIDSDYYSLKGAEEAEKKFGDKKRSSGMTSYANRDPAPLLWLRTYSPVDNNSSAIELSLHTPLKESTHGPHKASTFFGGLYEKTKMRAHSITVLNDPYELFGDSTPNELTMYKNQNAVQLTTHFLGLSLAFEGSTNFVHNLDFVYNFGFIPFGIAYAEDIHYQRPDLEKDPSINFFGALTGLNYKLALRYRIDENSALSISHYGSNYTNINGSAIFNFSDGGSGYSNLNKLFTEKSTPNLSLTLNHNW